MRIGLKGKQVIGVTSIVGAVVVSLSLVHLANLARVQLEESQARAELLGNAIFHRAREVIAGGGDPYEGLRSDPGLRSILESSLYSKNVTFAAIVDTRGVAVAHADPGMEGRGLPPEELLSELLAKTALSELAAIYAGQGRNLEYRQPLLLDTREFGSIRIGVSTLLIRQDLGVSLEPAITTALAALGVAVGVALLLAQLLLRPIHVIRSGLTRLGRGELDVRLDLKQADEFGDLGTSFNEVTAQLSADRSHMAGQVAHLESAVQHLEDALAVVSPRGEMLFTNPAMRTLLPRAAAGAPLAQLLPADNPVIGLFEQTLVTNQSRGPLSAVFPDIRSAGDSGERLVMTHAVTDPQGQLVGVMFIARNLEYLSQVQSTIRYSRKLAALGRLSAGVAHEVKNPLNAMMIHLELLRQHIRPAPAAPAIDPAAASRHVDVIAGEIRRLDEVVQGFLKFSRPEDLRLQPVSLDALFREIVPIVRSEAERARIELHVDGRAPDVNGDPAMLRQLFLNLALNACQAMPSGGTLRIHCEAIGGRRVAVSVVDTGVGIAPEHLQRIFDLYFTTKPKGSGIGLSMVYRTVQMHDGDIEVQSTPGAGTTFRVLLPQA
ncbi:MAG: HAMP domain-containing protein [Acidobacteria bacterium]|nr:HAMP domain-containing protein [Acidobacteriota bacterium]